MLWARGDLNHWRYETVDLASHLRAGANVLAAVVWNDGPHAALSQHSHRTAFLLQANDTDFEEQLNTGAGWRCMRNPAYEAIPVPNYQPTGYYAIGPCERVDLAKAPWGWETAEFSDAHWAPAEVYRNASSRDGLDAPTRWMLVPRPIPAMEETPERLASVRASEGVTPPTGFPASAAAFSVPPRSKCKLLLDHGHLTTAFPVVQVSGGAGARVRLEYTEALYQEMKPRRRKGNRGETEGKTFVGYGDEFVADGKERTWRPLYWRTYRYIQLSVETADEPLTVADVRGIYTGYPFARAPASTPASRCIAASGTWAGGPLVCARMKLTWTALLRATAVRGRHTHSGDHLLLCLRRRAPRAKRHRADRLVPHRGRRDAFARPVVLAAVHSALLALVDRHVARLLVVCR